MGYYMSQLNGRFALASGSEAAALEAALPFWEYDRKCASLSELLENAGWDFSSPGELSFIGQKAGEDDALFAAIAPFVEAGSFIDMIGEDNAIWRWYFDGQELQEYRGEPAFPDCPAISDSPG